MKPAPAVLGIIIAGALGYVLEPSIRPALMSMKEKGTLATDGKMVEPRTLEPKSPLPPPLKSPGEAIPAQAVPDWVLQLTPEQLPEKVTLKQKVTLPVDGSGEPMVLPAGVSVSTVRLDNGDLVISPFGGPMEGRVPISSTDLVELLGEASKAGATMPEVVEIEPAPLPVEPSPAVSEAPAIKPAEPTPEPTAPAPSRRLTDEEIISVMQESVKAGSITEFTFAQALDWKAAEDKESGGQTYQSGLVSYRAETIFGVKNIQAQALIMDGKVVKWIWPKSGMEIN